MIKKPIILKIRLSYRQAEAVEHQLMEAIRKYKELESEDNEDETE